MPTASPILTGHVQAHQDARTVAADSVTYDEKTGKLMVKGAVDFEDPRLRIRSDSGTYDALGGANFDARPISRSSTAMAAASRRKWRCIPTARSTLTKVRYTTCPVGNQDWMLQASSITLDTEQQAGHRARSGHALQGCADILLAVSRVSTRAMSARAACCSRASGIPATTATARGALLLQSGAELRPDPHARLFVRARRAARRRIPLSDGEFARSNRGEFPAKRCHRCTATAPSCISPTSPT